MHRKVDPAALLFAVLAASVSPLTTTGPWDSMDTTVAVVVGVILLAFTWPRPETLKDDSGQITEVSRWVTTAVAIAYGLIVTTGAAWLVQLRLRLPACWPDCPDKVADQVADRATHRALVIGGVFAVILFAVMRVRIRKLRKRFDRLGKEAADSSSTTLHASNGRILLWVMIIFLLSRRSSKEHPSRQLKQDTKRDS